MGIKKILKVDWNEHKRGQEVELTEEEIERLKDFDLFAESKKEVSEIEKEFPEPEKKKK